MFRPGSVTLKRHSLSEEQKQSVSESRSLGVNSAMAYHHQSFDLGPEFDLHHVSIFLYHSDNQKSDCLSSKSGMKQSEGTMCWQVWHDRITQAPLSSKCWKCSGMEKALHQNGRGLSLTSEWKGSKQDISTMKVVQVRLWMNLGSESHPMLVLGTWPTARLTDRHVLNQPDIRIKRAQDIKSSNSPFKLITSLTATWNGSYLTLVWKQVWQD